MVLDFLLVWFHAAQFPGTGSGVGGSGSEDLELCVQRLRFK